MKGFKAIKSFYHGKMYYKGDSVNIDDFTNKELEENGLVRWVERPVIIMPTKKRQPRRRKDGSKGKK